MNNKKNWQLPITIVFILLGILLSAQLQTQNRVLSDLSMQKTEDLIVMVKNLSEKRVELENELTSVEIKLNQLRTSNADEENIIKNLQTELKEFAIINGTEKVTGPGLKITIDKDSPVLYIDFVNIINELWAAGAEAICLNDVRINIYTSIYYSETESSMYITVNNKPLTFPIIIKAIGNPNTLEKGLTLPGGIMDNLALFGAYPVLEKSEKLVIPAVKETPVLTEAKPVIE